MIWRTNGVNADDAIDLEDKVDHPDYYRAGNIECLDVIEALDLNFNRGNALKYIFRAGHKDDELEDLKKARRYLDREIQRMERA